MSSVGPSLLRFSWLGGAVGIAIAAAAYGGWIVMLSQAKSRAVAVALTHGDPDKAPALVTRYGCGGCHTIAAAPGADGKVAPGLTGIRERVYVGGVLRNTPDNLVRWIVNPPAFSPRTAMPITGITEAEARDVAALLYMD